MQDQSLACWVWFSISSLPPAFTFRMWIYILYHCMLKALICLLILQGFIIKRLPWAAEETLDFILNSVKTVKDYGVFWHGTECILHYDMSLLWWGQWVVWMIMPPLPPQAYKYSNVCFLINITLLEGLVGVVWPYQRRLVTSCGLWGFKNPCQV